MTTTDMRVLTSGEKLLPGSMLLRMRRLRVQVTRVICRQLHEDQTVLTRRP